MELDQQRADRLLEGAPVGVVVSSVNDASTYHGFCAGEDPPPPDVDAAYDRAATGEVRLPRSYACCPIYAAAAEWDAVSRLMALRAEEGDRDLPELDIGALEPGGDGW